MVSFASTMWGISINFRLLSATVPLWGFFFYFETPCSLRCMMQQLCHIHVLLRYTEALYSPNVRQLQLKYKQPNHLHCLNCCRGSWNQTSFQVCMDLKCVSTCAILDTLKKIAAVAIAIKFCVLLCFPVVTRGHFFWVANWKDRPLEVGIPARILGQTQRTPSSG